MYKILISIVLIFLFTGCKELGTFHFGKPRVANILVIGQSNAGYHGSSDYFVTTDNVFDFGYDSFIKSESPINPNNYYMSATLYNTGGNPYASLGNKLIDNNDYEEVNFINVSVGGTKISSWRDGASNYVLRPEDNFRYVDKFNPHLFERILFSKQILEDNNLELTHIIFHLGESDSYEGTLKEDFKIYFKEFYSDLRKIHPNAPFYLSKTSYTYGLYNPDIIEAQTELMNELGLEEGINTDLLNSSFRWDNVHFNKYGLEAMSNLWYEALIN